jgi:hypothetical protein
MRLSDLTFKLYRASTGASAFWHWEVLQKGRKAALRTGYVYGTMADAKKQASAAMIKLANTGKVRPQKKS